MPEEAKKEEGQTCCSGGRCCCSKALAAVILLLLGGVIGYLMGMRCGWHKGMMPYPYSVPMTPPAK